MSEHDPVTQARFWAVLPVGWEDITDNVGLYTSELDARARFSRGQARVQLVVVCFVVDQYGQIGEVPK